MEQVANCDLLPEKASQAYVSQTDIEHLILNIRGTQVIIDRDLAMLYQVETKRLKKQLKSTRWSAAFAFATLIVTSLLGLWRHCSSTRIESQDLESIAKSFQYMKSSQPTEITAIVSDTIMTIDSLSSDSCYNTTP
ncbi:MAG: ORF6N domain-containing protein [Bacteroidales bacterium]|nr:ORF6N domain-containing protein [Bacteroidales bacterium]